MTGPRATALKSALTLCCLLIALTPMTALPAAPATATATGPATPAAETDDPYRWLEDVQGERALAWVQARNAESRAVLAAQPRFAAMRDGFRAILDSRDKIPAISRQGDDFYNFWRDADHPRGLWRRTTLADYRQPQPAWHTVIDLDALARDEGENWVWAGATCLPSAPEHCLVHLSRGGADAAVVREFNTRSQRFVADGFVLPEAKSDIVWLSLDAVYVGTDFGPGSLTDSGYPRLIKRWQRGQPLAQAITVFEGRPQDVSAQVSVDATPGFERTVFSRATDFYRHEQFILRGETLENTLQEARQETLQNTLQKIHLPDDATISFWRGRALLRLRSDWAVGSTHWPGGSLLVGDADAILPRPATRCRRCKRCSRPAPPAHWPATAPRAARCW